MKTHYVIIVCLTFLFFSCEEESPDILLEQKINGFYNYSLEFIIEDSTSSIIHHVDTLEKFNLFSQSGDDLYITASLENKYNIYFNIGQDYFIEAENFKYIDTLQFFTFDISLQYFTNTKNEIFVIKGSKSHWISRDHLYEGLYKDSYTSNDKGNFKKVDLIRFTFEIIDPKDPETNERYIGLITAHR